MPNPTYIPARIQHRMGKRQDLPQPLMPGEIGFCVDTDQVFIGSDPDDTSGYASPVIHVYSDFVESINNGSYLDTAYENTYIYVVNKILEQHLFVIDLDEESQYPSINEAYDNTTDSSFMVKVEYEQIDQFGVSVNIKRAYIGVKSSITQPNTYPDVTGVSTMIGDFAAFTGSKLDMSSTINGGLSFGIKDTAALVNVINWVFDNSSEFSSVMSNGKSIVTMGQNVELLTDRNKTFNEELKTLIMPLKAGTDVKTGIWFSQYDSDCYDIKYSIKSMNYLRNGTLTFGMILNQSDLSDRYSEMTLNDNFTQDIVFKVASVSESNNTAFELLYNADGLEDNTEFSVNIERWRSFKDALPPPPIQVVPTFQVSSVASVDEGEEILFDVTSTNFGTGVMYWTIQPTSRSEDFTSMGGSFTITNDQGSFSLTPTLDSLTEGNETFEVVIRAESQTGTIVAKSQVITINDTSTTPNPTFNMIPESSTVNEGESLTINVITTNFEDGILYWSISSSETVTNDFVATSGPVNITNNSGSILISVNSDLITEGSENFVVVLRSGSISGQEVARTGSITINDTSTTPNPTFSMIPESSSVNEGGQLTINVNTTNFQNGRLYWIISTTDAESSDFQDMNGFVDISNNSGSFLIAPSSDSINDSGEKFIIILKTDSVNGQEVARTGSITINDTSPTYSVTPNVTSINEGGTVRFDVSTANVQDTTLYWNVVSNGNILNSDFTGSVAGSFQLVNGVGLWSMTATEDLLTEGNETFTVQLRTGSNSGTVVATSSSVTINDTSITPASPTYSVTPNVTSINEGGTVRFDVSTTNFPDGPLYWVVSAGSGASLQDFDGTTAGLINIVNGSGSWDMVASQDNITEGNETFTVQLRTGSQNGTTVATSSPVTINDTSKTPTPTYSVTPNVTSINEGGTVRFDVSTTNIQNTTLYWSLTSNSTASASDFSGSNSGSFSIVSNAGSFDIILLADVTTEGPESFSIDIRTGSTTGPVVATSESVTVNDTSTTPTTPPPGGGGGCLLPHVLIAMADGSVKRADEVNVGDQVLGATFDGMLDGSNAEWREWTTNDISSFTISTPTVKVVKYDTYHSYYKINESLFITISHKIFVNDGNIWGWKDANDLKVGDTLINGNGEEDVIYSIELVNENTEVVDFDVEDIDTYFAGGYLVHNAEQKN